MIRNIYIVYEESYSGGEICAGQEDDDWPDYEDQNIYLELKYATLKEPSKRTPHFDIETIDSELVDSGKANKVYAVLVRYYDGGTFGRTCGYHKFEGIFDNRKAAESVAAALKDKYGHRWERSYDGNPWTGYFAGFEGVSVEKLDLE